MQIILFILANMLISFYSMLVRNWNFILNIRTLCPFCVQVPIVFALSLREVYTVFIFTLNHELFLCKYVNYKLKSKAWFISTCLKVSSIVGENCSETENMNSKILVYFKFKHLSII